MSSFDNGLDSFFYTLFISLPMPVNFNSYSEGGFIILHIFKVANKFNSATSASINLLSSSLEALVSWVSSFLGSTIKESI